MKCLSSLQNIHGLDSGLQGQGAAGVALQEPVQDPPQGQVAVFRGGGGQQQDVLGNAVLGHHVTSPEGALDAVCQLVHVAVEELQGRHGTIPHGGGNKAEVHGATGAGGGAGFQVIDILEHLQLAEEGAGKPVLLAEELADGRQVTGGVLGGFDDLPVQGGKVGGRRYAQLGVKEAVHLFVLLQSQLGLAGADQGDGSGKTPHSRQ